MHRGGVASSLITEGGEQYRNHPFILLNFKWAYGHNDKKHFNVQMCKKRLTKLKLIVETYFVSIKLGELFLTSVIPFL